jgi:hypothetical protein
MARAPAIMLHKLDGRLLTFRVGESFAYKRSGVTYVEIEGKEYKVRETLNQIDKLIRDLK